MADHNPTAPSFAIELEGKTYALHYARRDFANAEWRLKMPLLGPESKAAFWSQVATTPGYATDVLLFIGLQRAIPGLTMNQVQDFVTFDNSEYVEKCVLEAFQAAMPRPKPDQQVEEPPADARPLVKPNGGISPGPSADTTSG